MFFFGHAFLLNFFFFFFFSRAFFLLNVHRGPSAGGIEARVGEGRSECEGKRTGRAGWRGRSPGTAAGEQGDEGA